MEAVNASSAIRYEGALFEVGVGPSPRMNSSSAELDKPESPTAEFLSTLWEIWPIFCTLMVRSLEAESGFLTVTPSAPGLGHELEYALDMSLTWLLLPLLWCIARASQLDLTLGMRGMWVRSRS